MMMMVLVFLLHLGKGGCYLCLALHCLHQLTAGELIPRGRHNGGIGIMLPQHGNSVIQLLLGNSVRTGQDDRAGGFDLVIIKLAKILHIDLDLACVYHSHGTIQLYIFICHFFHGGDHIRQLAHAGGLNDDPVRSIVCDHLGQCLAKIAHQAAADTAGVHLRNVDPCILQKSAVNADLTKFVFDENELLTCVMLGYHFLDQGRLTGPQKTGVNINFRHFLHTFLCFLIFMALLFGKPYYTK